MGNEETNMDKTSPQFLYIPIFFSIGIRRESHGFIIKFGAVESWLKTRKVVYSYTSVELKKVILV